MNEPDMTETVVEALHHLSKELSATLQHASRSLEAFVENKSNKDSLLECADALHSVFGALSIAQVAGGAQLANEMERVARSLPNHNAPQMEESLDVLSQALVQLPVYLERVQTGGRDVPLVLLPLLNDLRTVRGDPLLSENTLFLLNLSKAEMAANDALSTENEADAAALAAQFRPKFQASLLGWITGDKPKENLEKLVRLAEQFQKVARVPILFRMWRITAAVLEALLDDGLEASASVKRLLGQVDRQCKRLIDRGEGIFETDPPDELLNNLLYYVARANSTGKRVTDVRQTFNLGEAIPNQAELEREREQLAAPSIGLMQTVASAIKEDLARVKDGLDIYVRAGIHDRTQLSPQKDSLQKIADTMTVLGLTDLRGQVTAEVKQLGNMIEGNVEDSDENLMDMAATMLRVEDKVTAELTEMISPPQQPAEPSPEDTDYQDVSAAVIRECIVNLARVKESIVHYLERPDAPQLIQEVPNLIHGIRAGMLMMQKDRVRDILGRIEGYARQRLQQAPQLPEENEIDRVADAIVSVEYYLETLQKGRSDPWYMLDNAEACLDSLADRAAIPDDFVAEVVDLSAEEAEPVPVEPQQQRAQEEPHEPTEVMQQLTPPVFAEQENKVDPEFIELFIEEAKEEVDTISDYFPRWRDNPSDLDGLGTIRRSFHTLKGSGRMVGAELIGEFSWSIENLLNRVLDRTLERNDHIVLLLEQSTQALPELIEQLEVGVAPRADVDSMMQRAWALADGERGDTQITSVLTTDEPIDDDSSTEVLPRPDALDTHEPTEVLGALSETFEATEIIGPLAEDTIEPADLWSSSEAEEDAEETVADENTGIMLRDDFFNELILPDEEEEQPGDDEDETTIVEKPENLDVPASEPALVAPIQMDEALMDVFVKEATDHLTTLRGFLEESKERDGPYRVSESVHRATHTLLGSANAAGASEFVILATPMDHYVSELFRGNIKMPEAAVGVLDDFVATMNSLLGCINVPGAELPETEQLIQRITDLDIAQQDAAISTAGFEVGEFFEESEADDVGGSTIVKELVEQAVETPDEEPDYDPEIAAIFAEEATELLESADQALSSCSTSPSADALARLKRDLHTLKGGARMAGVLQMGDLSHLLETTLESLEPEQIGSQPPVFDSLQAGLDALHRMRDRLEAGQAVGDAQKVTQNLNALFDGASSDAEPEEQEQIEGQEQVETTEMVEEPVDDMESELVVAETQTEDSIEETTTEEEFAPELEIEVPTSELDVRLEDTAPNLDLTHDALLADDISPFEQAMEDASTSDAEVVPLAPDSPTIVLPDAALRPLPPAASAYVPHLEVDDEDAAEAAEAPTIPVVEPRKPAKAVPLFTTEKVVPRLEPVERQEVARVGAELLQRLLDNAGEISIYRARLEQQLGSISFNLEELSRTVIRVHEQLRNLEIETEAQILHTHKTENDQESDFDPLELDRYSTLQQLTRAMAESANDLSSIEGLLENYTSEAEKLLLQQSRVTTELQDGLMRTRMVPFYQRGQRLARLVRQTASDVGKRAELQLHGTGEIDRQMLERMMPPLEHMVRNAVIHGIELPDDRGLANKPEMGVVQISLHREGSEMVLEIADDGRGLDVTGIRDKALKLGLIDESQTLGESDVMQLIMEPGLTTAEELTQAAGRGVGMDVVANEIKQLGGSLFIDSETGAGTKFSIRLPFTLAISQALLVRAAGNIYALPLPSIEGIARISIGELESYLSPNGPAFNYGGEKYQLQHLGVLLGGEPSRIPEDESTVPLVMVRAGEFSTALITDEMLDRQEIVVKSVGPQIGSIRGISGATILGDGSTAVILDPVALVRVLRKPSESAPDSGSTEDQRTFVLVVDDSITVRRVTERLLERNGMRVMTAKDGADAVSIMQEHVPDIILLDIEMPRMDGYEVAAHVRGDPRLERV
ncbi:MAG: Hpt domain-containing protein, partial [Pseudomonadota bacterium]